MKKKCALERHDDFDLNNFCAPPNRIIRKVEPPQRDRNKKNIVYNCFAGTKVPAFGSSLSMMGAPPAFVEANCGCCC